MLIPEIARMPGLIKYTPPKGATREVRVDHPATGPQDVSLFIIAPRHPAHTLSPAPTIYYYQSAPSSFGMEVTLVEKSNYKAILSIRGAAQPRAGIHRVTLSKQNISLAPGVTYRVKIALIVDEKDRSKDIVASAEIMRVSGSEAFLEKLKGTSLGEKATTCASAGFWFDAVQSLTETMKYEPHNSQLKNTFVELLLQADLHQPARYALPQ